MQLLRGNPDFDLFFIYDEVYCNRKMDGVIPTIMAGVSLLYVIGDRAKVRIDNEEIELLKDRWYVIGCDENYTIDCCGKNGLVLINCHVWNDYRFRLIQREKDFSWSHRHAAFYTLKNDIKELLVKLVDTDKDSGKGLLYGEKYSNEPLKTYIIRCLDVIAQKQACQCSDARADYMLNYIHHNFTENVSLSLLASMLHISVSSCSRSFYAGTGFYFEEYIKRLRFGYALGLLGFSMMPVTQVAMESGFSSVIMLNRAFRQYMDMTPSGFREMFLNQWGRDLSISSDAKALLQKWLQGFYGVQDGTYVYNCNYEDKYPPCDYGIKGISAGELSRVNQASTQKLLLDAKENLGIRYVGLLNIFSKDLHLRYGHTHYISNFTELDSALDFLVANGFCPCLELNVHERYVIGNIQEPLFIKEETPFLDFEEKLAVILDLVWHCVKRYGEHVVRQWKLDYWFMLMETRYNQSITEYVHEIGVLVKETHRILPKACVGGGRWNLESSLFGQIIPALAELPKDMQPDFLSVQYYPYIFGEQGNYWHVYSAVSALDYNEQMQRLCHLSEQYFGRKLPIYVTEWNESLCSRTIFNDSVEKAATAVSFAIRSKHQEDWMSWFMLSDKDSGYYDVTSQFFGGLGLYSKDGLAKPVYQALKILKNLNLVSAKSMDKTLIGKDARDDYHILSVNIGYPDMDMTIKSESVMTENAVARIFHSDTRHVKFVLNYLEEGEYVVRCQSINKECSDIRQMYERFLVDEMISLEDENYVKTACSPKRSLEVLATDGKMLCIDADLSDNEIVYYHICKKR